MQPQAGKLFLIQLKHEVLREALAIAIDLLIKTFGCFAVKSGQVGIEHHALAANQQNASRKKLLLFRMDKTDGAARRFRCGHQLAQGGEDLLELSAAIASEHIVLECQHLGLLFKSGELIG